jgi:uncharacterized protein
LTQVVEQLWQVQELMTQLADHERKLQHKPEEFASIDEQHSTAKRELDEIEAKLESIGAERRSLESDLQDAQETLKKYQGQLMQVKNQQQYAAAWKEIDTARKNVKDLEDRLLAQMNDVDTLQKDRDEKKEAFEPLQAKWQESYDRWQASLGDLRSGADALRQKISAAEQSIPKNVLAQFHRVASQRQGAGMTKIVDSSCSHCRFKLRSQAMQQLKRGELITCEGCHRFAYLERAS